MFRVLEQDLVLSACFMDCEECLEYGANGTELTPRSPNSAQTKCLVYYYIAQRPTSKVHEYPTNPTRPMF